MDKTERTLKAIMNLFTEILKRNPNYTGSITINFCLGGVTEVQKKDNIKI